MENPTNNRLAAADIAYRNLVEAARAWAVHMDQFENFQFETAYGPIFVSMTMKTEYPASFDVVDLSDPKGEVSRLVRVVVPESLSDAIDQYKVDLRAVCETAIPDAVNRARLEAEEAAREPYDDPDEEAAARESHMIAMMGR